MLRDFQTEVKGGVYGAWQEPNVYNVMPVMATGSGKTTLFCDIVKEMGMPAAVIAHRQELVGQAALALNRERVEHSIIAPKAIVQQIIHLEHEMQGYSTYNSRAPVRAAGVDTIIKRDTSDRWFSQVGLVVQDEGHHVLAENKWGKAQAMFPNARALFPTAHAVRADRKGLGRGAEGLTDKLVIGPCARDLINRGFLTDYRIICVGTDIDFSTVAIGSSGDFSMPQLRAATHKSNRIVGDVVKTYLRFAPGKLGVTFAVDIEAAIEICNEFNKAGVPAAVITADTPLNVRGQLMRKFRARQLLQLVSVDCLGEGVDVPAIEVISMARKTASWQLMCQQCGRTLRVMVDELFWNNWGFYTDEERLTVIANSNKPKAMIIDHVGNIVWHAKQRGWFDMKQEYSLLRGESSGRGGGTGIDLRTCISCYQPYERYFIECPYCGSQQPIAGRSSPELVEGDLVELDPQMLAALRGEIEKISGPVYMPSNMSAEAQRGIIRNHHTRAVIQQSLQKALMLWGGWQESRGLKLRESQKLFFLRYGVDVMQAQSLGAPEMAALETRIREELKRYNIIEARS